MRTGTYAEKNGTPAARPTQGTAGGSSGTASKPYSRKVENPYGRYTSGSEEDSTYTASFKPGENRKPTGTANRRRNNNGNSGNTGNGNGEDKA